MILRFNIFSTILTTTLFTASGQEDNMRKNNVFIEAGGAAGIGSMNYERLVFHRNQFTLGTRIGFGMNHFTDPVKNFNPDILIPLGANGNYILLKTNRIQIEGQLGLGAIFSSVVQLNESWSIQRNNGLHGFMDLGARIRFKNGLNLQTSYTPIYHQFDFWRHWGGISIGYAF